MAFLKSYLYRLLLFCVVLTAFSGCTTPITTKILEEVAKPEIDKTPENFQYYISKKVTLVLDETNFPLDVKNGVLEVKEYRERRRITIARKKPGIVLSHETRPDGNGYLLQVGFEKNHPDCVIWFGNRAGDEENYYLRRYDDDDIIQNRKIIYGGRTYTVNFEGNDPPFLLIGKKPVNEKKTESRRAKGWKLDK